MRSTKIINIISCHAEGEVGNVIVGGVPDPPGESILQKSNWIDQDQRLRKFVLNEPRGGVFKHINLLVPPKNKKASFGFIIMSPEHNAPMSGSNSICVATVLLDSGMIPIKEPETTFFLEAPAGLIEVKAYCNNNKAEKIEIKNVTSFAEKIDTHLEVQGIGTIKVDIAFGGDSFVIVDAKSIGFEIVPNEAREISEIGTKIKSAANDQIKFQHPIQSAWNKITFCQFTLPVLKKNGILYGKNTVVIEPGKLDRSPYGTGCSARMAVLFAKKEMKIGDFFQGISIIDSKFDCKIFKKTKIANIDAISPIISGRGWITGTHQLFCDPEDPWPEGYRLTDTWIKY